MSKLKETERGGDVAKEAINEIRERREGNLLLQRKIVFYLPVLSVEQFLIPFS